MAADVISINVDLSGLTDVTVKVNSIMRESVANVQKMLLAFGYIVHADAVELIQQGPPRSGAIYFRNGNKAQRSAYGQPAKSDTGILASSLRVIKEASGGVEVGYLDNVASYGEYLEDNSKLNRQVLEPTFNKNRALLLQLIRKAIKDAI